MKNILIILIAVTVSCSPTQAQTVNELNAQEFENIQLSSHSIGSIWTTSGDQGNVTNLFGQPSELINNSDHTGISLKYIYNGFTISFSGLINARGNLAAFEITSTLPTLTVKGVEIRIGDNISKLGSVQINNKVPNGKNILFTHSHDDDIYIAIDFEFKTNTITKIRYNTLY